MKTPMEGVALPAVLALTSGLSWTYLILATYFYRGPQGIQLPKDVDDLHIDDLLDQDTPVEVQAWEAKIARRKLVYSGVACIAAAFCMTRGGARSILWTMHCASMAATGVIWLKQKEPALHWRSTQFLAGVLTCHLALIAGSTWSRKQDLAKNVALLATVASWCITVTIPRGPPQVTRSSYTYPSAKAVPITSHQVQSSLINVITFSWLMPVLQDAWTREKLGEKSSVDLLPHLPYTSRSFYLSNLFKRSVASSVGASGSKSRWSTQHPFYGRHPYFVSGLVWRVYIMHSWTLFVATLYQITHSLSTFLPALLTRQFLKALERREEDGDKTAVYLSLGILVLASAARVVLSSQVYTRFNVCEGRLKTQLNSMLYEKMLKLRDASVTSASTGGQSKQANILNLFSEDSGKTAVFPFHVVNTFISFPLEIVSGGIALYVTLGLAGFVGLLVPLAFVPFTKILVTKYFILQKEILQAKDKRVSTMNEILASIRFIKFMAQERACEERVMQARRHELSLVWKQVRYGIAVNSIGLFGPVFALVAAFAFYTKVQGRVLSPADAFSSAIITGILRYSLDGLYGMIPSLAADIASLRRVDAFLSQEGLNANLVTQTRHGGRSVLAMNHVDAAWASDLPRFLHNLNCDFEEGVNLIVGPLGSGKTLLLLTLLGESVISKGKITQQIADSPKQAKSDETKQKLNGRMCAFAPQTPWLVNGSVRDNILFGAHMEEARYQDVLHACSLLPDLELFADGDQTQIGERGVILSGGQKARVGLARALYSPATFLFLDDVLSAVDSHTAQHIIKYCFSGHLVEKRVIVLVSHQVQLCLTSAATVLHLDHGNVLYTGTAVGYSSSPLYASLLQALNDSHVTLGIESTGANDVEENPLGKHRGDSKAKQVAESKALVLDEGKGVGDIGFGVWMFWARSNGGSLFWLAVPLVWASSRGSLVLIDYWTSRWTDHDVASTHPQAGSNYYIGVSLALCLLAMIPNLMRWPLVYLGSMRLSSTVYADMLHAVLRSPMRWFDTNLLGRLYNRFGHDIQVIDVELSKLVGSTAISIVNVLFTIIAVTAVSAWALLIVVPVAICWIYYGRLYKVAARDFRRLDAVNKSPLFSLYSETVSGAAIIRAFGASKRFLVESHHRNDASQMFMFLNWYLNRWLGFRFELLSVCLTAAAGLFVVLKRDMAPGLAGFTLAVVQKGGTDMMWLFRQLTYAEVAMVSVERLQEYTQLPPEPDTPVEQVPASWPERGEISVEGLSVRYSPGLPQILKNVSFRAAAGQKIGIVGATGSGKSTLALSFFRFVTADAGQITIDGVDTSKISLFDLRSRLSIVPQEPTILSGTLRNTLDSLREGFSDLGMYDTLRRVHLLKDQNSLQNTIFSNLDSHISEQGKNLSAGEKQLLCLARAILRKSKIVLLDEATSSVDFETDQLVTHTLAEEFRECTMLVIAHRLRTIIGFDKVLVMHNGEVAEFGSPRVLLADPETRFYGLCQAAGAREFAALQAAVAKEDS